MHATNLRTYVLMAVMTAMFLGMGALLGGGGGVIIALLIVGGMNFWSYWNSDKAVLRMAGAREVTMTQAPVLVKMVNDLSDRAGMPRPKVYIIETDQPNAFATGRNPQNAAVAATTGLMRVLNHEELAGVMAHELAHIQHRDTLTMTLTVTFAGAIAMLANFAMFFGSSDRERPGGMLGTIALMILAPMAAGVVQMAISRSREYEADRLGAEICGQPQALASALLKIEQIARGRINEAAERNPALAHMFIINPLNGRGADNLFSTHPSTANRVAALAKMTPKAPPMAQAPRQRPVSRPINPNPFGSGSMPPPPPPPAAGGVRKSSIPKAGRRNLRD